MSGTRVDVLVIGSGQAGLATARVLSELGIGFVVHERHARIGDSWRERFDSLTLFSPRAISALPGLPLRGDPDGYPHKDEIGDYLEDYAREFALPVITGSPIVRLVSRGRRLFCRSGERTIGRSGCRGGRDRYVSAPAGTGLRRVAGRQRPTARYAHLPLICGVHRDARDIATQLRRITR